MVGQGRGERNGRKALISRSLNYLLEFGALVLLLYFLASCLIISPPPPNSGKCPTAKLNPHSISSSPLFSVSTVTKCWRWKTLPKWRLHRFVWLQLTLTREKETKADLIHSSYLQLATVGRWTTYFGIKLNEVWHFYQSAPQTAYQLEWLIAFGFLTVFIAY